jgi:LysR family transcriptional regulator, glycine cleavage system transcriptional activator
MRRLPPLSAVRAFEAAGRHENFTTAATELAMTQAAVSYQIKVLEERLSVALFRRERRRVVLTEAGRRALTQVSAAFDTLDSAFAGLRAEDESVLTISASTTFANVWLAARLGGFQMAHPGVAVRLDATNALADFVRDDVDCGLRTGRDERPGLAADMLFPIDFTPMCSADFLARHGGRIAPEDMFAAGVISSDDPWWKIWFAAAGIAPPSGDWPRGVRLDSQSLEGSAVKSGQGIALLTPFLWRADLAEGRLVRLSEYLASDGESYWLVCPEHRRRVPKIARFREWLLAEIARDRALLA